MPKGLYNRKNLIRDNHNHWKGGKPKCACGKILSGYSKFKKDIRTGMYFKTTGKCRQCFLKSRVGKPRPEVIGKNTGSKNCRYKHGLSRTKEYQLQKCRNRRALKNNSSGEFTDKQWSALKEKFNNMCLCCKRSEPEIKLESDHIIPLYLGGSNDISNIQPLCKSCNCKKGIKVIKYDITLNKKFIKI